ncbi:MAG: sigma-70 family RNA polymerase sigma factor, partial [Traorella sp.]
MVQRFSNRCENMDDLFQVGCIGLVKSIENFDLSHDVKFSTYAVPMILGEIKRYLRDNQMMRISRNCKELAYQCFKLKEDYYHEYSVEPSIEYLCEQTKASNKDVVEALESFQSVLSLFEPIYNSDGDEMCLVDTLSNQKDDISLLSNLLTLRMSLKQLNEKELDILNKRYYLDYTQSEIAKELGISQAQVSRLEKGALKCLKKNFE